MSVIVTDTGFTTEDWTAGFIPLADLPANDAAPAIAVDLASDSDPAALAGRLQDIDMIRVDFPSFADGRGFTIAKRLRQMGFQGRLRARGHVISDQYAMARRVGFDEVEISEELAARQPEAEWLFRADWQANDYQARLRA
ncbi:hypothetical protein PSA7680_00932 [Pseudoruegeria aquimaris]|uniref:Oxidoreductase n=1 Tax=Pseudoruegeria aquimaris TaxID=393663 RepID=A0A1Y5RUH3_9RHOB|nr:DUF934 domain-containing protein [Pseudoruegeria aquimaris]SLN22891.1 hypothetical protein PSA7680_00932 [Pseudoruegeria aquimaris]